MGARFLNLTSPLPPADSGMGGAIGWSLVLIAFALAAFYGVIQLRRWLKEEDVPTGGIGFSLSDLRQLVREGKMTPEEYERARAKMVTAGKAMAEKLPDPLAGRRRPGGGSPPAGPTSPGGTVPPNRPGGNPPGSGMPPGA